VLLRTPRADLEVGVAIPVACMVPLAIAAAVLVGASVFLGTRLAPTGAGHVVVGVIADGAVGGPRLLSTQVVLLRGCYSGAVRLPFFARAQASWMASPSLSRS
jgi:hypothetical protein